MKLFLNLLLVAGLATLMSCNGEMGPAGPAGQDGADGPAGQDGTDGQDGNANVKNLELTIQASNWVTFQSDLLYVDLNVPIVTGQIANTGMVMVYFQEVGTEWYALPYARNFQNYFFWVKPGQVRVHSQNTSILPTKFTGKVRVVAVSAEGMARNPDLDWTNYEAVKSRLEWSE